MDLQTIQGSRGSWIYIIPVVGLSLTDAVNNEISIKRVTFITLAKLSRVRIRFGIPLRISELRSNPMYDHFFSNAGNTVAILRMTGKPIEISSMVIRWVVEALEVLSVSQLGFSKRRFNSYISIYSESNAKFNYLCLNPKNSNAYLSSQMVSKGSDLILDERWDRWQKEIFFKTLVKIINGDVRVDTNWRECIHRACRLVGQSLATNNVAHAFLFNMIAIELLLTKQGDKYTQVLPKRIEAFLGWVGYWEVENYVEKIEDVYGKRCQFVHDGNDKNIEIKDLLFTDDLLLNILMNIVTHHRKFSSKDNPPIPR